MRAVPYISRLQHRGRGQTKAQPVPRSNAGRRENEEVFEGKLLFLVFRNHARPGAAQCHTQRWFRMNAPDVPRRLLRTNPAARYLGIGTKALRALIVSG